MAVITSDTLDVLCHAAVRARNCAVLLATCSDAGLLAGLRQLSGSYVQLTMSQVRLPCSSSFAPPAKEELTELC